MQRYRFISSLFIFGISVLTACNALPQAPTPTPTRRFSAATLAPTQAIVIQNSDELYGDSIRDGQSDPTAAALPVDAPLPPLQSGVVGETGARPIQISISDALTLTGDLYQTGSSDNRVAGILILADDPAAWGNFAPALLNSGYTVLVVDMPDGGVFAEVIDVLLRSLSENGSVDPARMLVVGAGNTADIALLGCAITDLCDAVVMLSPQNRNALLNVLPNFNPRPMFVAASLNDADSYATASSLATSFAQGSQFSEQSTGSGTGLLTLNGSLTTTIITWLGTLWS